MIHLKPHEVALQQRLLVSGQVGRQNRTMPNGSVWGLRIKRFVMGWAKLRLIVAAIVFVFSILAEAQIFKPVAFASTPTPIPEMDMANYANTKLSVRDAIDLSIRRNFSLRSQALTIAQKENLKWASYSDLFPQLSVTYDSEINRYRQASNSGIFQGIHPSRWTYRGQTNNPTFQPLYPYRIDPYKLMTLTATLTQPLYNAGRLGNSYRYAIMDEIASGVDMATMCRDLTNSVIQSFYHVVLGKKLSEVADESIRELTAFKARAKALLKHGEALRVDVSAAEATLAKSKARKSKVVTDMQTAMAQLNFLLAFPQGACLKLDDKISYEPSPYKCPDIYMIAVSNRSEVAKANISIDQAKAQVKIAQSSLAPDINLQLQGQRLNDDWNVLDPEGTNDYSVQGTLVWAFDIFRSRETVRKTRNAYAQTFVNKEYLVQQIMREVNTAYLQVKQNEANVEEFRTEIKWRKDQLDRIKAMYNQQLTTYLNVMDAIASLDLSKSNYFTAAINHIVAVAELERQMGTLR